MDSRIQKLQQRAQNLLSFLSAEAQKNPKTKQKINNFMPNLDQQLWAMHDEIFEFEQKKVPTTKLRQKNKKQHRKDLIDFVRWTRYFYCFYYRTNQPPKWMSFNPRSKKPALEFLKTFFQKLQQETSSDFQDKIDQLSFVSIQQAKDIFDQWQEITLLEQNTWYGETIRTIYNFLEYIKAWLFFLWYTHFEIKSIERKDEFD